MIDLYFATQLNRIHGTYPTYKLLLDLDVRARQPLPDFEFMTLSHDLGLDANLLIDKILATQDLVDQYGFKIRVLPHINIEGGYVYATITIWAVHGDQ